MAPMSCCKEGASLSSDPDSTCLVFLITSEGSIMNVDGIRFYRAPRWVQNVLASRPRLDLIESSASDLSPLVALELNFVETQRALLVDKILTIKSVKAY